MILVVRENRWMTFCFYLFFIGLVAYGPMVDIARSQTHFQNPLNEKNVLILNAFESHIPAFERINRELSAVLQSGGIGIGRQFFDHLGLSRTPGPEFRKLKMQMISRRYSERKIDLIITLYPESLKFLLDMDQSFFPAAPVIALFIPHGYELPEMVRRIIPHVVLPDLNRTIEIGMKLVPKAERVYVVNGTHPFDRWLESLARKNFKKWEDRLGFYYLSDLPFEKILATVSAAPANSIVYLTSFSKGVTGEYNRTADVSQELAKVSKAPVFGLFSTVLDKGNVGGSLVSFKDIGTEAGELALDILKGDQNTENIPEVLKVPQVDILDWRLLKHWNLSESDLPEGSVIINREFSLWDLKYYFIGVLVFIIVQSILIIGLLIQRRRRRLAEKLLWQKSNELDQFFNVSIGLLCIVNIDGRFSRLNPAWETALGYSREKLITQRFIDLVHPDDLLRTREAISNMVSHGKIIHLENRYRCKDGTYRWLEWNIVPTNKLMYAVAHDITDNINAEIKTRQHREELARVTRIITMGELTSSLAHEINQPLTAIESNTGAALRFLSQAEPNIDEIRQILEDIRRDDRRAGKVIQNIRAMVKKEKHEEELLDLNKLIQEVVDLIRGDFVLKGLSITLELTPELKMIRGDLIQLQQVILNLILNSAAAMKNAPRAQRKIIVRTAMPDNRTVNVSVTDFGTGIDANYIERLFDAFYTTKPEGLGMGLSISQTIVNTHGGDIKASNNREGGATFVVTLPTDRGDAS